MFFSNNILGPKFSKDIAKKTVAVENHRLTLAEFDNLKEKLPSVQFVTTSALQNAIEEIRIVKSDSEIEKIKAAQKIAEEAFDHILTFIKEGMTEKEISLELAVLIDNGELFNLIFSEDYLSLCESGSHGGSNKVFLGHVVLDGSIKVFNNFCCRTLSIKKFTDSRERQWLSHMVIIKCESRKNSNTGYQYKNKNSKQKACCIKISKRSN